MEYKIDGSTKCWNWLKSKNNRGYGFFYKDGKRYFAHRYYYEKYREKIPDKMCACHKCDNPSCVNPDHIFIGTHKDNMLDAKAKGRLGKNKRKKLPGESFCKRGHPLIERDRRGWFFCRVCKRINENNIRANKRIK